MVNVNFQEKEMPKSLELTPSELKIVNNVKTIDDTFSIFSSPNIVVNENFYRLFNTISDKLKKESDTELSIVLSSIIDQLIEMGEYYKSLSSFYEVIFYPILSMNDTFFKNSSLSDLNINIPFFKSIIRENYDSIYSESDSKCIYVYKYFFTDKNNFKLDEIQLSIGYGVKQVYNSKYKIKNILFGDNSKLNIPTKVR